MDDLISRREAIDAISNWLYDTQTTETSDEVLLKLPSAQPEIEERTEEFAQNVPKEDLISRKEAIDYCYALINAENPSDPSDEWNYSQERINQTEVILHHLEFMPSAQPEIKPISYQDCANAMMMMWMDNVLTDGEYRRIMDKLNDHESRRENR